MCKSWDKSNTQLECLQVFFFERLWPVRTVDFKAFFYNIFWFKFLEELHHFNVAIIPCRWKIFLDFQAQTLLISGTRKGEGRNVEDVMDGPVLLLLKSEIFFLFLLSIFRQLPKGSWGPWEEDQAMPHPCTSLFAHIKCCLLSMGAFYFSPHCYPGWITMSPPVPLCTTFPLKWERILGVVFVNLCFERTSVHQCTLAGV